MTRLPPHDSKAEAGFISCLMQSPGLISTFSSRGKELFYDLRYQLLFDTLKTMHGAKQAIDIITLQSTLKKAKLLQRVGGMQGLNEAHDAAPSAGNVEYYYEILRELSAFRKLLATTANIEGRIYDFDGRDASEIIGGIQADLDTVSRLLSKNPAKKQLQIWKCSELQNYTPPDGLDLIGDAEIFRGYEGISVMAGPGSSGKSLCTAALALAGARGCGTWMGRKVHRKFKTLILQAENGKRRLKKFVQKLAENHPEVDIENHIFFSEPPEGGLPFESAGFRTAVREEVERIKPDLVILDPWSHVGCEDAADAVKSKMTQIRGCFPWGDECPALMIVAHTVKPRSDNVRKGRGLQYMVTGSIALVNTSRCTYVMLPFTDDIDDKRVYFATPKLNDGENYAPTVWLRSYGTDFIHDEKTDPREFGRDESEGREKITFEHLEQAFDGKPEIPFTELAKKLQKISGAAMPTVYRALSAGTGGYLRQHLRVGRGKVMLIEAKVTDTDMP